jgi:hypothetical protein
MSLDECVARLEAEHGPKSEREYDALQALWNRMVDEAELETLFIRRVAGGKRLYAFIDDKVQQFRALDPRLHERLVQMRAHLDATQQRLLMAHAGEPIQLRMLLGMNADDMRLLPELDARLHPDAAMWLNGRRHWMLAQAAAPAPWWRTLAWYLHARGVLNPWFPCGGGANDTLLHRLMARHFPDDALAPFQSVLEERRLAVAMSAHARLGESTPLRHLDPELLRTVIGMGLEAPYY